jgi:hypothetical protein
MRSAEKEDERMCVCPRRPQGEEQTGAKGEGGLKRTRNDSHRLFDTYFTPVSARDALRGGGDGVTRMVACNFHSAQDFQSPKCF